jgi:hypothetical protein
MSNTIILKTFDQLKQLMIRYAIDHNVEDKTVSEEDVRFFVATQEAKMIADYSRRDIAEMLLGGMKPIDEEYVVEWLATFYEDIVYSLEGGEQVDADMWPDFDEMFASFYGVSESE